MIAIENIPAELRARPQWVAWRWEETKDGKSTKVPYRADGSARASSTDPSTWTSFEDAHAALDWGDVAGVGYVFSPDDPYCGIDFDDCLEDGRLHPDAAALVLALDSFTEVSPSGTGVKTICRGRLNGFPHHKTGKVPWEGALETYDSARFWTITGKPLRGTPLTIEARQAELDDVLARIWPKRETPPQAAAAVGAGLDADDEELLRRAFGARNGVDVERLYRGDASGYGSQSEADLALCGALAFWCGPEVARIDGLFRRSGLMREKWDSRRGESTYGAQTIAQALEGKTEFYSGPSTRATAATPPAAVSASDWPAPPAEAAYHGLAGEIVRAIEPHSEADPVALLSQLLLAFGSQIGRHAHCLVEADEHYGNLFATLVGSTAHGRKGTSWGHIRRQILQVDESANERIDSGLSSGEGLIYRLRDEQVKSEDGEEKVVDAGVTDKRLLLIEPEFASVLRAIGRESNRLSALLRKAWDWGELSNLTRNSPLKATNAHVSIAAHITTDELRRHLTETEAANGFGNRFLWFCVRRSKLLPRGGGLDERELAPLAWRLKEAIEFGQGVGRVERDDEAWELWEEAYESLTADRQGLHGAMTARGDAQVLRLSLLYALLDRSDVVRRPHLEAALALWDYAERSAAYIFGDSLGDPVVDEILRALRRVGDAGLTRTDLSNLFGRNAKKEQLDAAVQALAEKGLARCELEETGGRKAERWRAR
jgi:hypothetical protein